MATTMPPQSTDLRILINTVTDEFEETRQISVTQDGRQALIEPALPYQDQVDAELRTGRITDLFLRKSVTLVLDNSAEIAKAESLTAIDANVVRKSMQKYCPYLMWC